MFRQIFSSIFLLLFFLTAQSQTQYDFGFVRSDSIVVTDTSGLLLPKAWDGGLNFCQFMDSDLDDDGKRDLIVFDKCGDRLLAYINQGNNNYKRIVEHEKIFPPISGWIIMKDYNCDGHEDIFAYTPAGIKVYRNDNPGFTQVTPMLLSDMGSGYSNITVTYDDYPVIDDLDGDGDLDILVFFGLGSYLEMHTNLSIETTGSCDTLLFKRTEHCWGNFSESATNNQLFLNISCPWKCKQDPPHLPKHTGSTMLAIDMDNDSVKDLVLGDVDYFNLILLKNGGSRDSANIVYYDTAFPSALHPVQMISFPLPTYVNINGDGVRDLLISPFASNPSSADGHNSIWLYNNTGSDNQPVFDFSTYNWLQNEMIETGSGAYPVFYDYDKDGLPDLFVGNYGRIDSSYYEFGFLKTSFSSSIAYFRNTGSSGNPSFELMNADFAGLSSLKKTALYPTFADIDGDGDDDLLCGESSGKLIFFENIAGGGNPHQYSSPQENFAGIDAGDFSTPQFIDLDGDGLTDIVCGKKTGSINWYRNTGSVSSPVFSLITDNLGMVNVTDYNVSYSGYSTPCFFRDTSGMLRLFCGSESGKIYHFKNIESNLYGKFTAVDSILIYRQSDSTLLPIKDGIRSAAAAAFLSNSLFPDLVYGNFSGGLLYFQGAVASPYNLGINDDAYSLKSQLQIYPNPASEKIQVKYSGIPDGIQLRYEIFSMDGALLLNLSGTSSPEGNAIETHRLKAGIYLLRMSGNTNTRTYSLSSRFLIMR